MSDESPTRRLSQIFGSLSCLSELQNHGNLRKDESKVPQTGSSPIPSASNQNGNRLQTSANTSVRGAVYTGGGGPSSSSGKTSSTHIIMGSRSTPNSPRLMPKVQRLPPPAVPQRPSAALIASPALVAMDVHFSSLTDHLDVRQVNNYNQGIPEINWQERCLELQLELHRSKSQSSRIRDMLRDKVSTKLISYSYYI